MTPKNDSKRKSFVLYTSYANQIERLSLEEKGELLEAIFDYQIKGETEDGLSPFVDLIFSFMKTQFDNDRKKYEEKCARLDRNKRKINKKDRTDICRNQTDICRYHTEISSDNDNDNVNDNVNDNDNEYDNENDYVNDYDDDTLSDECVRSFAFGEGEGERGTTGKADKKSEEKGFEAFFEEYPRKQGKKDALSAWKKINPDKALREKIMQGLSRAKEREEWHREGGRYVPMAVTWLEGQRWEDEDICTFPRGRPYEDKYAWNSPRGSASYGNPEDFLELGLSRSYEKMRE